MTKYPIWKISKEGLKAFILIFPFIQVHVFDIGPLYNILIIAVMCYTILLIIKGYVKFRKHSVLLLMFGIWLVFSCIMNGKNIISAIFYGGKMLSFLLINEYYLQRKSLILLNVTRKYMCILIIITTFFQLFSQGLFGQLDVSGNFYNFSFGDNELGYYYISFLSLCLVLDRVNKKKLSKSTMLFLILCLISLFKAWSGKAIIGIIMIFIYVLFIYGKKIAKLFNYRIIVLSYTFIIVGIVFFNIQERFTDLLQSLLQKDATFTGRTYIWQSALKNIANSPTYGYGTQFGGRLIMNVTGSGHTLASSHNLFLEVLLQTGIIGFIQYIGFMLVSLYQNMKDKSKGEINTYLMLLFFSFVILIMYITTSTIYLVFAYLPIIMCANMNNIFKCSES